MIVNLLSDLSHVTMLSDVYLYLMFFEQSCIPLVIGIDSKCFESDRNEVCVGSPCWFPYLFLNHLFETSSPIVMTLIHWSR
ncbi:hypothetical protein Hanom_Chr02g00125041 [Helianthus anomalus]